MQRKQEIYLLSVLLIFLVICGFISVKWLNSDDLLEWLKSLGSNVIGALLMLIRMDVKNESNENSNSSSVVVTMEDSNK
jgi:hypothetical protein